MDARSTVVGQLEAGAQAWLVRQTREVAALAPFVRPSTPSGQPMRVMVTNAGELGWDGSGGYHYTRTQRNGHPWPPIPAEWLKLWERFALEEAEGVYPDSAVINWYEPEAGLGWHRDKSERDTSLPILTISLGDACSWAVRAGEHEEVTRTRLESGAVTLLAGPTRLWLHTVERIIPAPLLSPLRTRGRLSITMRVAG